MNLPDYLKCVEIKKLLIEMGVESIPELPEVSFTREKKVLKTVEIENPQLKFSERLRTTSVTLSETRITISHDGTLEINGLKACAYIKEQSHGVDFYSNSSTYKYHLCNCKTIEAMIADNRKHRYVSTTRSDGLFPVLDLSGAHPREFDAKLDLCKNCETILVNNGKYPRPYSLSRFFNLYQPEIPKNIRISETVVIHERYAPNHDEIADRYKSKMAFKCQMCNVDLSEHKNLLHLHHLDGNGTNNHRSNLRVLCYECHFKEPRHAHMASHPNHKASIKTLHDIRKKQGFINLSSF